MKLTELEHTVLIRLVRGEDPWKASLGSRTVSQAIQRLKRKGAIEIPNRWARVYPLTDAGRAYLELAGKISEPKA